MVLIRADKLRTVYLTIGREVVVSIFVLAQPFSITAIEETDYLLQNDILKYQGVT